MATITPGTITVNAEVPPPEGTTTPPTPEQGSTPTITHYQQLAEEFMRQLDSLTTIIPKLEASHISTADFVRSHLNVTNEFLATVIAAVEQTPALQGVNSFNVSAGRDTLQFIEAFRPVLDRVVAFAENLKFTLNSRKAALVVASLQIYWIAKGVARDPGNAAVAALVRNMKRDLGRRGPTRASLAARRAAAGTPTAGATPQEERS